eukprot:IDg2461t1
MDEIDDTTADVNFYKNKDLCTCPEACVDDGMLDLARQFGSRNEVERINIIRYMLMPLVSAPGEENCFRLHERGRKRRRDQEAAGMEQSGRAHIRYAIKGNEMCMHGFLAIVNLSRATLQRHAHEVACSNSIDQYKTGKGKWNKGKSSVQTQVAIGFLRRYSELNGLPCPRGRVFNYMEPVRILPSGIARKHVYEAYEKSWADLKNCFCQEFGGEGTLSKPLVYKSFCRVWREKYRCLQISAGRTDLCDTCVSLRRYICTLSGDAKVQKEAELEQHRCNARVEYSYYQKIRESTLLQPSGQTVHLVMDFAEKVLLPSMMDQPGNLHFVTGLKFDIFGISSSNLGKTYLFGLAEGHWKGGKSADEVLSMLFFAIWQYKSNPRTAGATRLVLHADNCGGQNKNRFVLWFCSMLTILKVFDEVCLHFLVAGHTKNVCDGTFGNVKKLFRARNVYTPKDMMQILEEGASNSIPIGARSVCWMDWKRLLDQYFKYPSNLKITHNHIFTFKSESPGFIETKEYASTTTPKRFYLLQSAYDAALTGNVIRDIKRKAFRSIWQALSDVPSAKEGNRAAYLLKNVLEKYFLGDNMMHTRYFQSGDEGVARYDNTGAHYNFNLF